MTTPVTTALDPWWLIPNRDEDGIKRALRLIVHGRAGGVVPSCIRALAMQVEKRRGTPVEVEALTAAQSLEPSSDSLWLIPLFLLPGAHVRQDVPAIRQRLQQQGVNTRWVPFLGAWPAWWSLLEEWVQHQRCCKGSPVLVHHPLRQGVAHRYLNLLQQRLAVPMLSWENWNAYVCAATKPYHPLPFALAPNRMTKTLREAGGMSSLLEIEVFRLGLVNLLTALP
ncbi:MAG TPA: DNA mismatch repair protein MutS [Prochlorococcus sp.]